MNVYSDTLSHDAVMVWLAPASRDVIGGIQMRTAPPPDVAEVVVVGEQALVQIGVTMSVADDTPPSDAVALALPLPVLVVEVVGPVEAVTAFQSVLLAAVGDDQPVSEGVAAALPLAGIDVAETSPPTDAVVVRVGLVVWDDLLVTDAAAAALPAAPVVADVVSPTEAVALTLHALFVAVADAGLPAEAVLPLANVALEVADSTEITERRFAAMAKAKKIRIRGNSPAR